MGERILDITKKSYIERSKHIEEKLNKNDLYEKIKAEVRGHNTIDNSFLGDKLDKMANYLLESDDLDSGRKIDESYYRSESYYNTTMAIGRNTLLVEPENLDYIEQESYEDSSEPNKKYLYRLFNPDKLTECDIRRFITNMSNYADMESSELREAIMWLEGEIRECSTDREWEIIQEFKKTKKTSKVAKNKQISDRYVRKILQKISKKCQNRFRFAK